MSIIQFLCCAHRLSAHPENYKRVAVMNPSLLFNVHIGSHLISPEWVLNDFDLTSSNIPGSPPTLQKGIRTAALRRVVGVGVAGSCRFNRSRSVLSVLGVIGFVNEINDDEATRCGRRDIVGHPESELHLCLDITSKSYWIPNPHRINPILTLSSPLLYFSPFQAIHPSLLFAEIHFDRSWIKIIGPDQ